MHALLFRVQSRQCNAISDVGHSKYFQFHWSCLIKRWFCHVCTGFLSRLPLQNRYRSMRFCPEFRQFLHSLVLNVIISTTGRFSDWLRRISDPSSYTWVRFCCFTKRIQKSWASEVSNLTSFRRNLRVTHTRDIYSDNLHIQHKLRIHSGKYENRSKRGTRCSSKFILSLTISLLQPIQRTTQVT